MVDKAPDFAVVFTGTAPGINCHIGAPDTDRPPGASWEPDGKHKATLVFEPSDPDLATLSAALEAARKAAFPDEAAVALPLKKGRAGTRHAGKVLFTATATSRPETFDRRGRPMDPHGISRDGDELRLKVLLVPWEFTERFQATATSKTKEAKVYGIAARLDGVQLIRSRPNWPHDAGGFSDLGDGPQEAEGGPARRR
ncbi:hypothetical protein [Roseomonas indoligenes]|uniref:Uncharacterized protein n=1 Tax=Roseomonas indoligenes TaxID=2820811 RepID=A0A940MX42_9PROT|nr:hypothetical protein [Pararoseomonas indoligenes]MBP0492782.1 hypothetical protein [Pararoseomonas indoligenes]